MRAIQKALELTQTFLTMYEEVSTNYRLDTPTFRIVIGKSYALFYRIGQKKKEIHVGRIFQSKQMKISFNVGVLGALASFSDNFCKVVSVIYEMVKPFFSLYYYIDETSLKDFL
ncbi:hypothetical protein BH744_13950 [Enterococcus villorum]|nr:hypothetical protein BH744_13950 [Enterococcus villorum]